METQALVGERGAYRLAQPIEAIQVPATVQAILAARIDRLAPEDKRLLQTAAVIGKMCLRAPARRSRTQPEEALRRGSRTSRRPSSCTRRSLFPDLEYTFKHALTHEVAYGSLLQERRRALHARIVDAIETLYPDRLPSTSNGWPTTRCGASCGRRRYLPPAGRAEGDGALGATGRPVACFEQALDALEHLPESRDTLEQAIRLSSRASAGAYDPLGERPAAA